MRSLIELIIVLTFIVGIMIIIGFWNFLVWIFGGGLLLGFVILVIYAAMFGVEFYPIFKKEILEHHILQSFQKVWAPYYKQTSIIIVPTMCEYHKKCARLFLSFSFLNAVLIFFMVSIGYVAYWSLVLLLLFFILAAAHSIVQSKYEKEIWAAAFNIKQENPDDKRNYIKKKT